MANEKTRRAAQTSLQDDRKTPFQRHDESVAAQRRNTSIHDQRVKNRENDRARWTHQTGTAVSSSGTHLDPETARLKTASDASRVAQKQPPTVIDVDLVRACVLAWRSQSPDGQNLYRNFKENEFNKTSLKQALEWLLAHGTPVSLELPQLAYERCVRGDHLNPLDRTDRDGNVLRLRSEAGRPAPTLHPRHVWSDEIALNEQAKHDAAVKAIEQETQRALTISFEELRAEARSKFKAPRPGAPNLDRN